MGPIYNFSRFNAQLACSGQPAEEQLQDIAEDGYKVIINLAPAGTKYSLPDEAGSAAKLGLVYHHIPVQFDSPQLQELEDFLALMKQHRDEKILVHCAANYRASCFTGLYLLSTSQLNRDEIDDFIADVWQPDAIWQQFLEDGAEFIQPDH